MGIYRIEVDTHVHSVLSGHAWSTLRENITQAKLAGLKGICITEHSAAVLGAAPEFAYASMALLPESDDGIRLYHGQESDILSENGRLCPSDDVLSQLDFCIASIHMAAASLKRERDICTAAYLAALDNPYVSILGHIDRTTFPCDLETVIKKAGSCGKMIELNNASLAPARAAGHENVKTMLKCCIKHEVPICVSSDAHFDKMVGNFRQAEALLEELHFPEELIINASKERFEEYLKKHKDIIKDYERRTGNAETDREFLY